MDRKRHTCTMVIGDAKHQDSLHIPRVLDWLRTEKDLQSVTYRLPFQAMEKLDSTHELRLGKNRS
jgi:hypothetical protein